MTSPCSIELPSAKEYREFAEECLSWANRAPSQNERNTLVDIARVWMQMAYDIECHNQYRGTVTKYRLAGLDL